MSTAIDIRADGTDIDRDPKIRGGCPILAGTGITVRRMMIRYKQGYQPEQIADEILLFSLARVYAVRTDYHADRAGIEADIAREGSESDRWESLPRSGQVSRA